MKVFKFGGTSVGSAEGRDNICSLATEGSERTIIVVSALGGVTDSLISFGGEAALGHTTNSMEVLEAIAKRHHEAVNLSTPKAKQDELHAFCDAMLEELRLLALEIISAKSITREQEAAIVAYGEKMSSRILCSMMEGAQHIDSTQIVKTIPYFSRHIVDFAKTNSLIREKVAGLDAQIIVMGGFISSDSSNDCVTNLGRGGSDYSAAIVAAALKVDKLYIYTDVDGFLSCDPRIVPEAVLIDELGFVEAMELCNFGAKVVYPPTIFPAYNAGIPIVIRSTYNHSCPGTTIMSKESLSATSSPLKGISSINDTALLCLRGLSSEGLIGVNYRIFRSLSKQGISIFLVSQSSDGDCTEVAIKNGDVDSALEILRNEFSGEISRGEIEIPSARRNLAIVAVVGSSLEGNMEVTSEIMATLSNNGISIICSGFGGAHQSIAFVTELSMLRRATRALHEALFVRHYDAMNIAIGGDGSLAESFSEVVRGESRRIFERYGVRLNLVSGEDMSGMECPVLVDCGGELDYCTVRERGINVVSGNLAGAYRNIEGLSGCYYGGCIGEGLPIVRVLGDLVRSGDIVGGIEAVPSGFMNYALGLFGRGLKFSVAVRTAYNNYYGECDLVGELSGELSVERVALAVRGCGVEEFEVCRDGGLYPSMDFESIGEGDLFEWLSGYDSVWEELRGRLSDGERYVYVVSYGNGVVKSNLRVVSEGDEFWGVDGYGVCYLVWSSRYREYPLQLLSYEQPSVGGIARSMFEDMLRIANIKL